MAGRAVSVLVRLAFLTDGNARRSSIPRDSYGCGQ